jgi:hypothetical protein
MDPCNFDTWLVCAELNEHICVLIFVLHNTLFYCSGRLLVLCGLTQQVSSIRYTSELGDAKFEFLLQHWVSCLKFYMDSAGHTGSFQDITLI